MSIMSVIICRSLVQRGRTNLVRMLRFDASNQYHPIISATRHIHWNSQPNKPNSATSRARGKSDSSSIPSKQVDISSRIVTCVEKNKYAEALDLLHVLKRNDKLAQPALRQILPRLSAAKLGSVRSSFFMAEFWDMCDNIVRKQMAAEVVNAFAVSFDYADDIERTQQLANHVAQRSPTGPSWIAAFSLVSHVFARHHIVDAAFQSCVARFLTSVPSYTMPMLHHRGAVSSLLSKKRVDEAVDYLKSHAASLQISNDSWNFVMTALHAGGRSDEIAALYELWMSVLPPIDELKQRANYQKIVPHVYIYNILLDCESITPELVLSQLDVFGSSSDASLHNRCVCNAAQNGYYETALRLWGDMCKRGFAVNITTMSHLTDIVRLYAEQPEHLAAADRLAVLIWHKYPPNGPSFQWDWYAPYMSAFRRLNDIKRTLELTTKLKGVHPDDIPRLHKAGVISDVLHVLKEHNQMDEYEALVKWLSTK